MHPSSRNIKDLHPRLRSLYINFDAAMRDAGIDFIVTCTYRSSEEQNRLYAQGRTTPGAIVTWAKGGESNHNYVDGGGQPSSHAFDIAIMKHGKIDWDIKNPDWKRAGVIGQRLGLVWGGSWAKKKDYPHFELPKGE